MTSLGTIRSHLFTGQVFEGRNLVPGYSRLSFQWVCVTVKYRVSKSTRGLRCSEVLVAAQDSGHRSHLPPATFCESSVYRVSASVWDALAADSQFPRSQ